MTADRVVPGLGHVPPDWDVVRIEDCCRIHDSRRVPLNEETRRGMQGDIPYCGANGVLDHINDYIFNVPILLVAEDGGTSTSSAHAPSPT